MRNFKKSTRISKILNKGAEETEKSLGKNILHLSPGSGTKFPNSCNFLSGRALGTSFVLIFCFNPGP